MNELERKAYKIFGSIWFLTLPLTVLALATNRPLTACALLLFGQLLLGGLIGCVRGPDQ
jgi:hypothetical protein